MFIQKQVTIGSYNSVNNSRVINMLHINTKCEVKSIGAQQLSGVIHREVRPNSNESKLMPRNVHEELPYQ